MINFLALLLKTELKCSLISVLFCYTIKNKWKNLLEYFILRGKASMCFSSTKNNACYWNEICVVIIIMGYCGLLALSFISSLNIAFICSMICILLLYIFNDLYLSYASAMLSFCFPPMTFQKTKANDYHVRTFGSITLRWINIYLLHKIIMC